VLGRGRSSVTYNRLRAGRVKRKPAGVGSAPDIVNPW
jgi:hypothetical protein